MLLHNYFYYQIGELYLQDYLLIYSEYWSLQQ